MQSPVPVPSKPSGRRTPAALLEAAKEAQARAALKLTRATARVTKREATVATRARKLDTRKKIIAGALALEHMQFDGRYGLAFRALIDEYVTRDEDRALFQLEPLPVDDQRRAQPPKVY